MAHGLKQPKSEIFLERVAQGEEKTVREWAEVFFEAQEPQDGQNRVRGIMRRWRKKGQMLFSIKINGEEEPGIVKLVNKNFTQFNAAYQRHASATAESGIISSFEIAEKLIEEHPKFRDKIVARCQKLLEDASNAHKSFLGISYVPSGKTLAGGEAAARPEQSEKDKKRRQYQAVGR